MVKLSISLIQRQSDVMHMNVHIEPKQSDRNKERYKVGERQKYFNIMYCIILALAILSGPVLIFLLLRTLDQQKVEQTVKYGIMSLEEIKRFDYSETSLCGDCSQIGRINDDKGLSFINLNTAEYVDLELNKGQATSVRSWQQSRVSIQTYANKGICEADITFGNSRLNDMEVRQIFCQECAEKILRGNQYELALFDATENKVIPIKHYDNTQLLDGFYIRTEWYNKDNMKYLIFHTLRGN